jgi:hypothetical protein
MPTKPHALTPPKNGVVVRMYRQGLGDSFLLAFPAKDDGQARYVLIDCGVLKGQAQGGDRLRKIMGDIKAVTNNHLHLVIATHEHVDHLSGFCDKRGIFGTKDCIKIDEMWMAWTEDPSDEAVAVVKARKQAAMAGLTTLAQHLCQAEARKDTPPSVRAILGMMEPISAFGDFTVPAAGAGDAGAAEDPVKGEGMMEQVKKLLGKKEPTYLRPGQTAEVPHADALDHRAYVLGPPRERDLLRGEGRVDRENTLYFGDSAGSLAFLSALQHFTDALEAKPAAKKRKSSPRASASRDESAEELKFPFDGRFRRPLTPVVNRSPAWRG